MPEELIEPFECCCITVQYACGEYFVYCDSEDDLKCTCNCPACFHSSKELTIQEWNTFVKNRFKHKEEKDK